MTFDDVVRFHGHACPGLAIGFRMAQEAMEALGATRSDDEEVVAIVENNSCGVDALQCVTGCTFGKGNLIFRDWGKMAYTLYSRRSRKGVRVTFNRNAVPEGMREDRERFTQWVLTVPAATILNIQQVSIDEPEPARIHRSIPCDRCGEFVMETRLQCVDGAHVCIPCVQTLTKNY
ncbi:MAG: FmdE family protein [Desulfobacterota bacterium]|nr:FmdE family protein [Thermodesulfobacteriota bacterium]